MRASIGVLRRWARAVALGTSAAVTMAGSVCGTGGADVAVRAAPQSTRVFATPAGWRLSTVTASPTPAALDRVAVPVGAAARLAAAAPTGAPTSAAVTGWTLRSGVTVFSAHAGQGVAVIIAPGAALRLITRGNADIPPALALAGWVHVGDPDAHDGYLVDAYQTRPHGTAKMFLVTAPDGRQIELTHPLASGEMVNNSFAAVSPDGRWLVSGEWNTMTRLLVFQLPTLTPTMRSATLRLAGTLVLSHPVRDVQGCAFTTGTTLVCSTNDTGRDLFLVPRQLLSVRLAHPLSSGVTAAVPTVLGAVPQQSPCPGVGETEGLDATSGQLRLVVTEPGACHTRTRLYTYSAQ